MHLLMNRTITDSINGGRTTQEFVKGSIYAVPDEIGPQWVERGWALVPAKPDAKSAAKRKE